MNIDYYIANALAEDIGSGDVTGDAIVPSDAIGEAKIFAKQDCVVAGLSFAAAVFSQLDTTINWKSLVDDGTSVSNGDCLAVVCGKARAILRGERLALNALQHLSGVATYTRKCVDAVAGKNIAVLDTRKTIPGMRDWQKHAVAMGGGQNHRMGLYDRYMIKSNHVEMVGGLEAALKKMYEHRRGDLILEVEVRNMSEIDIALEAGADWIMLDNFKPSDIRAAVQKISGKAHIEISGGVTLENIRDYAIEGIAGISLGALTHSVIAADINLQLKPVVQK